MNWLKRWKRRGLTSLTYDELRLRKVKAKATKQRWLRDLQELENQHHTLMEEAKRETSPTVQQVKARQVRDCRAYLRVQQANMTRLGKYIQVLTLLEAYKELGQDSPFSDIIKETDLLTVGDHVDGIVSEVEVSEQKLDQILKAFGEASVAQSGVATGDSEVDAILAEIQLAAATDAIALESRLTETWDTEAPDRIDR